MKRENELEDAITDIEIQINRAGYMSQEIMDRFFCKVDENENQKRQRVSWEFGRHSAFMELLNSCIYNIQKTIQDLSAITGGTL